MDACIDNLREVQVSTELDTLRGCCQVPIKEEDKEKTTFVSCLGTYRYTRMPLGLCNTTATFQRTLDIIPPGIQWETCLSYIGDVVII